MQGLGAECGGCNHLKLRWGRDTDLANFTKILAIHRCDWLEMPGIVEWCALHKTTDRLEAALSRIPPL